MKRIILFAILVVFSTLSFAQVSKVEVKNNTISWITPMRDDLSEIYVVDLNTGNMEKILPVPGKRQSTSIYGDDIRIVIVDIFGNDASVDAYSKGYLSNISTNQLVKFSSLKKEVSIQSVMGVDLPALIGYENLSSKGVALSDTAQEGKSFKFFMNTTTLAGNRYMKLAASLGRDITFPKGSKISGNMMVPAPLGDVQLSVTLKKGGVVIMNSALYQISKGDWRRQNFQFPEIDGVFDEVQLNFSYLQNESGLRNLFLDGVYVVTGTTEVLIDDCNGGGTQNTKPGVTILSAPVNGAMGVSVTPTFTYNPTINTTQYQLQVLTKNGTVVYDQKNAAVTATLTTPLAYNTQYDWRVKCWNGSTPSDNWSATFSFTTITQVVSVPVFTIASRDDSQNFITLNWFGGEVELQLMVDPTGTVLQNPSVINSPYTFSNLTDGNYMVRGRYKSPQSDWSIAYKFTVKTAVNLTVPTLVSPAINSTGNSINTKVNWNGINAEFEVAISKNSAFTDDLKVYVVSAKEYTFSNLSPSTTYYWRVRAKSGTNYSSYSDTWNFMTVGTTGIGDENSIPTQFSLSQNYPNPFNPSTLIQFSLPTSSLVKISVYDITGREVKQLANQTFSGGVHSVSFDGTELSSGMYIYTVHSKLGTLSKKMTLVK